MERMTEAVINLLSEITGEDSSREGLVDTPKRVAKAWLEMSRGYEGSACSVLGDAFFREPTIQQGGGGLVLVRDIEFASMSEASLLPFYGSCHIAYLPCKGLVLGLSKFARITRLCAKRVQSQKGFTRRIWRALQEELMPAGLAVITEGTHLTGSEEAPGVRIECVVGGRFAKGDEILLQEVLMLLQLPPLDGLDGVLSITDDSISSDDDEVSHHDRVLQHQIGIEHESKIGVYQDMDDSTQGSLGLYHDNGEEARASIPGVITEMDSALDPGSPLLADKGMNSSSGCSSSSSPPELSSLSNVVASMAARQLAEMKRLERMESAVHVLLREIGEDPNRKGLLGAARTYAMSLLSSTSGYSMQLPTPSPWSSPASPPHTPAPAPQDTSCYNPLPMACACHHPAPSSLYASNSTCHHTNGHTCTSTGTLNGTSNLLPSVTPSGILNGTSTGTSSGMPHGTSNGTPNGKITRKSQNGTVNGTILEAVNGATVGTPSTTALWRPQQNGSSFEASSWEQPDYEVNGHTAGNGYTSRIGVNDTALHSHIVESSPSWSQHSLSPSIMIPPRWNWVNCRHLFAVSPSLDPNFHSNMTSPFPDPNIPTALVTSSSSHSNQNAPSSSCPVHHASTPAFLPRNMPAAPTASSFVAATPSLACSENGVQECVVPFASQCEHHLLPFYGHILVTWVPGPGSHPVGLAEVQHVVRMYTRRLQMQERITQQVADGILQVSQAQGVLVLTSASHMCMVARGVECHASSTFTVAARGLLQHNAALRLKIIGNASRNPMLFKQRASAR